MLTLAKNRAKAKGLPFDLTADDITVPVFCPILGIKLERGRYGKGINDAAPSLDKIDPEKGYVKGNVIVVSMRANRIKTNARADEIIAVGRYYKQLTENKCRKKKETLGPRSSGASTASPVLKTKETMKKKKTTQKNDNILLIDGDLIAYKVGFTSESVTDWGDGTVTLTGNVKETEHSVEVYVKRLMEQFTPKKTIICLGGKNNFRRALYPDYKAQRKSQRKPLMLNHVYKFLKENYDVKSKEGLEADDVLGILLTHPTLLPGKRIVVSADKDLLQVPGRHYNPDKDLKRLVKEPDADRVFWMQTLTGDSTDNYPGCPGIGPKRAEKLLAETGENFDTILAAYENAGLTRDDAILQARLARILRADEYDYKKKKPILWTP